MSLFVFRSRNALKDRVKQWGEVGANHALFGGSPTFTGTGIENWEIDLVFVGIEVEGRELIGASVDDVALELGKGSRDGSDADRDTETAKLVLVALEGAAEGLLLRCVACDPLLDLLGRDRPLGIEEGGEQVHHAFELVSSGSHWS